MPDEPDEQLTEPVDDSAEELYEHAPCGYLSTRPDGTIVKINRTLLDWLGYDRDEIVGRRTFQSLLSVGGRIYYETHYSPLLTMQGAVREIAVELIRHDGSRLPALVNSVLRVDASGAPVTIRTTVFDATSRRAYERELLAARRTAERSEERLAVLQQLVSDFTPAATSMDVSEVLVDKARRAVRAVASTLWLLAEDGSTLVRIAGGTPPHPLLLRAPRDAAMPHTQAVRRNEIVLLGSVEATRQQYPLIAELMVGAAREAVVFVPLSVGQQALGAVSFSFDQTHAIDDDDLQLLRTLGRQAGQALQRAALFEAESRLRHRAETLQLITGALAAPLDAAQVARVAVDRIAATLHFERIVFVLAGAVGPVVAAASGVSPAVLGSWRRDAGDLAPALSWPASNGAFFDLPEEHGAALPGLVDLPPEDRFGALAVLPLRSGTRSLGVLLLDRPAEHSFAAEERDFLRTVAAQCAQALERVRLHAEALERQQRAEFIAALSRRMDEAPGLRQRADRLVARLVPAIAERARVALLADRQLVTVSTSTMSHAVEAAATTRADPDDQPGEHVALALSEGTPQVAASATDEITETALPLRARGRVVGVLVLGLGRSRPDRDLLGFLTELAEAAGLALENGRLYDQERENGHLLQRGLLAGEPPRDPRVAVTSYYRPAGEDLEVGGDWYDVFPVGPDKIAVVIGDVVGRGIAAASAMGQVRSAIRALAATEPAPASLLQRLDRFVDRFEAGRMATVAYGELDLSTGRLRYSCAGHLPPLLIEPDGSKRFLWGGRSAPLAAFAGMKARTEDEVQLSPGSRLLLYTDGLVERRGRGLDLEMARLAEEAGRRSRAPQGGLLSDLAETMVDVQHRDDVCLLCVGFGVEPQFEREIAADMTRLKNLRDDFRAWLATLALSADERDALLLVCSEAAANAVEHGYRDDRIGVVSVRARVADGVVELIVRDRGSWRSPAATTDRGRGLALMKALMDGVSVERGVGTVVTMRRRLTSEAVA
ncbi:SpoIIE family protein phosphatase [Micromonospora sp. NPDC049679]|uniref:SpoIIE family protein phosphatase n=1 Tax=Micromonospora sp. NPDC049679 TaxID=3155920 RepID=UPI0033DBB1EA